VVFWLETEGKEWWNPSLKPGGNGWFYRVSGREERREREVGLCIWEHFRRILGLSGVYYTYRDRIRSTTDAPMQEIS
jgi:hypothetical protein